MEDLKRFKETHGHVNVTIPEDRSLYQFCAQVKYAREYPSKSKNKKLTIENIARLDSLGFNWTSQEYVTRSFDERIEDLKEYKRTHGHVNVNRHKDNSLYQFCAGARHSLKQVEKDGTKKLTEERMAMLDALGFKWYNAPEASVDAAPAHEKRRAILKSYLIVLAINLLCSCGATKDFKIIQRKIHLLLPHLVWLAVLSPTFRLISPSSLKMAASYYFPIVHERRRQRVCCVAIRI